MSFAVISGGGTGIGAATARALTIDGYDVMIVGRRPDVVSAMASKISAEARRSGAVTAVTADLAVPSEVARVVDAVGDRWVDALVNNAGGFVAGGATGLGGSGGGADLEAVADHWRRNFDVNVLTAVLLTTALLKRLSRPGGRVVFLSSIAAQRGGGGPYSGAKAALHGWAYDLARSLGPEGVTVNVVSSGYVAETEFFGDRMTAEGHASRVGDTLVGRAGTPGDIAALIRYLVGPEAGYVTGQILSINGGSVLGR